MFLLKATDNYNNVWYAINDTMDKCVTEIEDNYSDYIINMGLEWFEVKPIKVSIKTVYEIVET